MRLSELSAGVPHQLFGPPLDPEVRSVQHDSRRVSPGDLFAAFDGMRLDGRAFVPEAVSRGAVAVLGMPPPPSPLDVPYLAVDRPRHAGGVLAARAAGDPSSRLTMVGITGTSGKTTTTLLVDRVLAARHAKRGLFGTLVYRGAGGDAAALEASRTTPEATELQPMLAALVADGGTAVTMECSSHALVLSRLSGCQFDVTVFLNLSRDHLDFHTDLEDYFEAKVRLFSLRKPGGIAVVNAADSHGVRLIERLVRLDPAHTVSFSVGGAADVTGLAAPDADGTRLVVSWKARGISFELRSPLLGMPNAENLLAAATVGLALGIPPAEIVSALESVSAVPGRLERVPNDLGLQVLVDYAHKPGALEGVLRTARTLTKGRVIVVFGCGGDRDRGKRPEMGAIAVSLADETVVTSDNPRTEDPMAILDEIRAGTEGVSGGAVRFVVDRREAIALALSLARPGDVVLVAGKGHETYQTTGNVSRPFDDRVVCRELLEVMSVR